MEMSEQIQDPRVEQLRGGMESAMTVLSETGMNLMAEASRIRGFLERDDQPGSRATPVRYDDKALVSDKHGNKWMYRASADVWYMSFADSGLDCDPAYADVGTVASWGALTSTFGPVTP